MHKSIKSLLLIAIIALTFSCEEDKNCCSLTCDVEDPAENLPWLKTMIDSWESTDELYRYFYVEQGNYLGQTVFIIGNCCPFCGSTIPVFDCEGELLWYTPDDPDKTAAITDLKVIWKSLDSECTM